MVTLNNYNLRGLYIHRSRLVEAYTIALRSPDPRTQVGAVIYNGNTQVSVGLNTFPNYMIQRELEDLLTNENKHLCLMHAERHAILSLMGQQRLTDLALYAPYSSCTQCAIELIQVNVRRVYRHAKVMNLIPKRWRNDFANADKLFELANVEIIEIEGKLGVEPIRFDGKLRSF